MKKPFYALLSGAVFGVGLSVSEMINPEKVQNFLDIAGRWDPSLALVMVGALAVAIFAFKVIMKRDMPIADEKFHLPTRRDLDQPLLMGAALFGVGWGMTGLCPGPAVANLGLVIKGLIGLEQSTVTPVLMTGMVDVLLMIVSILVGMMLYRFTHRQGQY